MQWLASCEALTTATRRVPLAGWLAGRGGAASREPRLCVDGCSVNGLISSWLTAGPPPPPGGRSGGGGGGGSVQARSSAVDIAEHSAGNGISAEQLSTLSTGRARLHPASAGAPPPHDLCIRHQRSQWSGILQGKDFREA